MHKALKLDFGELTGMLKDPEQIGACFVQPAEIAAELRTLDRDLTSEFASSSRRLSQPSKEYPVLGPFRRRPRFRELLTDLRPLVRVSMYTMGCELAGRCLQMLDCRSYDDEPDGA